MQDFSDKEYILLIFFIFMTLQSFHPETEKSAASKYLIFILQL